MQTNKKLFHEWFMCRYRENIYRKMKNASLQWTDFEQLFGRRSLASMYRRKRMRDKRNRILLLFFLPLPFEERHKMINHDVYNGLWVNMSKREIERVRERDTEVPFMLSYFARKCFEFLTLFICDVHSRSLCGDARGVQTKMVMWNEGIFTVMGGEGIYHYKSVFILVKCEFHSASEQNPITTTESSRLYD